MSRIRSILFCSILLSFCNFLEMLRLQNNEIYRDWSTTNLRGGKLEFIYELKGIWCPLVITLELQPQNSLWARRPFDIVKDEWPLWNFSVDVHCKGTLMSIGDHFEISPANILWIPFDVVRTKFNDHWNSIDHHYLWYPVVITLKLHQ